MSNLIYWFMIYYIVGLAVAIYVRLSLQPCEEDCVYGLDYLIDLGCILFLALFWGPVVLFGIISNTTIRGLK